ncbi:DEAD/DEAH box helicase [Streptomyces sp. NPDC053474]|uniref:DEAD/DEAH box helicase n=1 Tax=Streptomyces sp. NPDC053474 TaxID=3365704 RepID=UPI0037CD4585
MELAQYAAGLDAADPPRRSQVVFWRPSTTTSTAADLALPASAQAGRAAVVRRHGAGVRRAEVACWRLPILDAVPYLARARVHGDGHPATVFWGAAALFGLRLLGEGRLLPDLTPSGYDTWRLAPLTEADQEYLTQLAEAMPPEARALVQNARPPYLLPRRAALVTAFTDALADAWPRTAAATAFSTCPAFATTEPVHAPHLAPWVRALAAGQDEVRVSLQVDLEHPPADEEDLVRVTIAVRASGDTHTVAAADVWRADNGSPNSSLSRVQDLVLLTLRRGGRMWPPLLRALDADVPGELLIDADEVRQLLGDALSGLTAAGINVLWPSEVVRSLTARLVLSAPRPPSSTPSLLTLDCLMTLRWRADLEGQELTQAELAELAATRRPVVRLRERWVLVDEKLAAAIRRTDGQPVSAAEALRITLEGSADVDGARHAADIPDWLTSVRRALTNSCPPPTAAAPAGLKATLRHYQLAALGWLDRLTSLGLGACLADDMGLGKTITLISLCLRRLEDPRLAGPTLVVCPASMLGGWEREIRRFAPGLQVRRFHGPGRHLDALSPATVVITTYATARLDREQLTQTPWSLVCADEAQHLKNPYSATARALRALPAQARVALTGTPMENNLSELWSILDFALPGLLGPLAQFRTRYARPVESRGDPHAAQKLATLIGPFLLRRLKTDPGIAPELPPKTITDHVVALTREQAGLYAAAAAETLDAIARSHGIARRGLVLKLLTTLKQICNHPAHYLKEGHTQLSGRSGKFTLLDDLLDVILAEDGAVLIFTQYTAMARLIEAHLQQRAIASQFLHGATPVAARETMVQRFQDGEVPVFLLSLKAAGTGLTLTRAGHVIHFDRWWNPAVEEQATDRAYRIGQTQPVMVHRLLTEGTIEDHIADLLESKRQLADAVLDSGEAALTELSDAELADLVALRSPR